MFEIKPRNITAIKMTNPQLSITDLANLYARKGVSLRVMAELEKIDYPKLKEILSSCGYSHPRNTDLISNKIEHETGMNLHDFLCQQLEKGLSRNEISKISGIDNKTLQKFADNNGIHIPRSKSTPKNVGNIIKANQLRVHQDRTDAILIKFNGETLSLAEWSKKLGIPRSTIKSRLELGYPLHEALSADKRQHRGFSAFNKPESVDDNKV